MDGKAGFSFPDLNDFDNPKLGAPGTSSVSKHGLCVSICFQKSFRLFQVVLELHFGLQRLPDPTPPSQRHAGKTRPECPLRVFTAL